MDRKEFLNSKQIPTNEQLIKLFLGNDEITELLNKNGELSDYQGIDANGRIIGDDVEALDIESLGEPDDVEVIQGSEWSITKLVWDTEEGRIYNIDIIKLNNNNNKPYFGGIIDSTMDMAQLGEVKFNEEYIDFEDVVDVIPFDEQLNDALEDENFEEAARLRDWDLDLKQLIIDLKPIILTAIDNEDVESLDETLTKIRNFRKTL